MAKKYAILKKTPDPVSVTRVKTSKKYTPEDARTGAPSYGRESLTRPTPSFITKAQSEKKDIVKKGGKPFRAGRTEHEHEYRLALNIEKPDVKSLKVTQTTPKVAPVAGKTKQKFGILPKRNMERVDYLRNKDARGISKERRRPKKESGY